MRPIWRTEWPTALLFAVAALAPSAVSAQEESSELEARNIDINLLLNLPSCATSCFLQEQVNQGGNISDRISNVCSFESGTDGITACVISNCKTKESLIARNMSATACDLPVRDASSTYTNLAIALSVISAVCVLQRFIAKFIAENLRFGMDDYMVLLAALIQAPMAAIGVEGGVSSGLGRDIWTLTFDEITNFNYFLYIFTVLYFVNIAIIKLCFLFFYLTVFQKPKIRQYLWVTVGFVVCFGLAFLLAGIFQCDPISHYWTRWTGEDEEGHCVNISAVAWANGGVSIGIDLWMFAIPLSQVPQLSLDWKKKLEVSVMFCVGLFVTVISCVRLESLVSNDVYSPNATWVKRWLAIWSTVEINVGIICACLPSIRTLVVTFWGRIPVVGSSARRSRQMSQKEPTGTRKFGTVSRTMAEPTENIFSTQHGSGIHMQTTCAVEYEDALSQDSDETRLAGNGADMAQMSSSDDSLEKQKQLQQEATDHRW